MAGPGGREVGRVSIRALPDTSKFASSLKAYLERTERRLRLELPVSLNARDVARTEAELALLTRDRDIDLNIDKSILDGLGKSLGGLSSGGFGGLGRIQLIIGAIVASLPLIATAILALPSMLAAVLVPFATIAIGLDGIKDAAQVLVEPFQQMQSVISDVFEKGLTPVFENLVDIFPTLTTGFSGIAEALVQIADVIVGQLTSTGGLQHIADTFASLSDALVILAPAMAPLTDTLLILLSEGAAAFARFAPYLADMIEKFNEVVTILSESGALAAAFDSLSIVIGGFIAVFGGVVIAGAYVFTQLSLMARLIVSYVTGAWRLAKAAFSAGVDAVVALARSLPSRVTSPLSNLASKLWSLGAAAMRGLYNGLVNGAKAVLAKAGEIAGNIASTIAGALKIKSPSRVMMEIGGHIADGLALGIASGESSVVRSMQSLSGTVAGGIDGSLAFDASGTAGSLDSFAPGAIRAALEGLSMQVELMGGDRAKARFVQAGLKAGARL